MRKFFSLVALALIAQSSVFAQCGTPVNSVSANFTGGFPTCWYTNGVSTVFDRLNFTTSGKGDRFVILPLVDNCNGILEFDARNATNGQVGFCDFQIGAVSFQGATSMTTFEPITSVDVYATISGNQVVFAHYTVDLSSYAGSHQYIAIMLPELPARVGHIDNVVYTSACLSSNVTAVSQNIDLQLDVTGNAAILASDIDDGSTSDCGTPGLSIDVNSFTCDDIGPNTVMLIADDGQGNLDTSMATVNVLPAIEDETVSATASAICEGGSTTVTTGGSVTGIEYYLRDDSNNSIVDGPIQGTGSGLSFNTGALNSTTTFNVEGKPQTGTTSALDFSPTNGYLNFGQDNRGVTTEITVSLRMKTTVTGAAQFMLAKYNGVNGFAFFMDANGKINIDGRDGAGVYRQSGPSLTSVNDGQWHYVTGTVDVASGTWAVYVDGNLEAVGTNGTGTSLAVAYDMTLGQYTTFSMDVEIDQLAIWNYELAPGEVFTSASACLTGGETGLVGLYQFDEGNGLTVDDESASDIDASITGIAVPWVVGDLNLCILPATSACDFEMTELATVTVSSSYNLTESATACLGEDYTFPDGSVQTVSSQVIYTSNLTTMIAGCDSIIETTVNVTSIDNSTSLNGNTITANESGATYRWLDCDNSNSVIPGETDQSFTGGSGNYAVEITNGTCVDTSACTMIITVGIDAATNSELSVYPNPAKDLITISVVTGSFTVEIVNVVGEVVLTDNRSTINVEHLTSGAYTARICSNGGVLNRRFTKL